MVTILTAALVVVLTLTSGVLIWAVYRIEGHADALDLANNRARVEQTNHARGIVQVGGVASRGLNALASAVDDIHMAAGRAERSGQTAADTVAAAARSSVGQLDIKANRAIDDLRNATSALIEATQALVEQAGTSGSMAGKG